MNKIHVLDCTLRDGGYVNDWKFGDDNSVNIVDLVSKSGVDYAELAFIRICDYQKDKMEFSKMEQISDIFCPSQHNLAAMVEIGYGYPVDNFPLRSKSTVDLIRLVVWKRMIKESFAYAKALLEKGYEVAIQATRTEQYTLEEFAEFARYFSQLDLKAIYIVDTFGLLTKDNLLKYALVLDENLGKGICMGYHAHNNMQQAFSNMVAFCEHPWRHELIVDASVMGIGRGAGNLCLELFEKYLNENYSSNYNEEMIYKCADKYIQPIFEKQSWGYSIPYLLSAKYGRNPSYVPLLCRMGLTFSQMSKVFSEMRNRNIGIRFNDSECTLLVKEVIG